MTTPQHLLDRAWNDFQAHLYNPMNEYANLHRKLWAWGEHRSHCADLIRLKLTHDFDPKQFTLDLALAGTADCPCNNCNLKRNKGART